MFNHYAKMQRILQDYPTGWYVRLINEPTRAQKFSGETVEYDHYYRVYDAHDQPIKYCKFQQLDRFASVMGLDPSALVIITDDSAAKKLEIPDTRS